MSKFTPGPWTVDDRNPYVRGPENQCVADCWDFPDTHAAGEARANAYLVSAAPDLLDALGGLLEHYVQLVASGDAGFWDPSTEKPVIEARAAIAKAKGQS